MDEKEMMLIVLKAIHLFCKNTEDCEKCPFYLENSVSKYCMFMESVYPERWELEKIDFKEGRDNG